MIKVIIAYVKNNHFIIPGSTFLFAVTLLHLLFPIRNDDALFMPAVQSMSYINFITTRYKIWSSRVLSESVIWVLGQNWWFWVVSDILVLMLLYYYLIKMFANKSDIKMHWICMSLVLAYPFVHMSTSGYMITTLFYLWPMTFGLIAGYGMKKSLLDQKIFIWERVIYTAALLFAANVEQMNVFLLGLLTILSGYSALAKKRLNFYLLSQLAIVSALSIFILKTPGNAIRSFVETRWFPDYAMFGIIEKIQFGYAFTLSVFIFNLNLVFIIFCILLYITLHLQYKDKLYRIIAAIPLTVSIVFGASPGIFPNTAISRVSQFGLGASKLVNVFNFHEINYYVPLFFLGFITLCIPAALYLCFKNENLKAWFCIMLILLGFATGMIMGFSPTVWASNTRTLLFTYFAFIVCAILIYQKIRSLNFRWEPMLFALICFLGGASYLRYLALLLG